MIETAEQLLDQCASGNCRIVCTGDLTAFQIAEARAEGRMYVGPGGLGYVLLPWDLRTQKDAQRERDRAAPTT